ncbi:DNA nucleotidylexotransferase [Silurus asotus]|uniref:DNA nucleotidylexotransferase n=1 Tax=Silurus asotus TaxID=30991 RepID=A0AAD5FHV4_SILAS|nr:DNA nucleotidylexotransferase [Silurus asotus]
MILCQCHNSSLLSSKPGVILDQSQSSAQHEGLERSRKRRQPELTCAQPQKEMKFGEVTVYLVERRMGKSRRNFLTSLARSKGFCVDNNLSSNVTHIVAEDNPAHELWPWLQEQGIENLSRMNVVDITWFTQSMRAGRPIPVETEHWIQEGWPVAN